MDVIKKSRIRRKCLAVQRTQCHFCFFIWTDKMYKYPHKVICPKCGRTNATLEADDYEDYLKTWGLRRDLIAGGAYGFHAKKKEILKFIEKERKEQEEKLKGRKIA